MSKLQVNDIVNKDDDGAAGFSKGAVITGVTTSTSFIGDGSALTNINIPAGFTELDAALFN